MRPQSMRFVVPLLAAGLLAGCEHHDPGAPGGEQPFRRAEVSEGGTHISFPPDNPGLGVIRSMCATRRGATIPAVMPGRVVASIGSGLVTHDPIVLFESADVATLYSQYRQSRSNEARTAKALTRVKEMFETRTATSKDLNEAETDAANARSGVAECETKLRGLGFNPLEMDSVPGGTIWLICDVPESQLHEVQKGERVRIVFDAYPTLQWYGRADALGEVVDPSTRTVKVRVSASNPQGKFLPGMFARVDFGDTLDDVFLLPASAIVTVEGTDYLFIHAGGNEFVRRAVALASSGSGEVVVLSGLRDGDMVVTEGSMLLKGLSFGY